MRNGTGIQVDLDKLYRYDTGRMTDEESVAFMQDLADSGAALVMGGVYADTAREMIRAGTVLANPHR